MRTFRPLVLCAFLLLPFCCRAQNGTIDELRNEVEQLRKQLNEQPATSAAPVSKIDGLLSGKYGPNAAVTTKTGKLEIGGLIQVWYQNIQNDNVGIITASPNNNIDPTPGALAGPEANELLDNDTFRVRRAELRLTYDVTENITTYIILDPAREANILFTPIPTFPQHNGSIFNSGLQGGRLQQTGNTIIPQFLQDVQINFHDLIPHHDFYLGQFKPPAGYEAWSNSGRLDFVDRAMVTAINNVRDIGVMGHGTWYNDRLQYWAGFFNGPTGTVLTDPEINEAGNRSDDNDAKDFAWRLMVRPVWNEKKWYGRLEGGYSRTDGKHGEAGRNFYADVASTPAPINGLNRTDTAVNRQGAWIYWRPSNKLKGLWLRGEWGSGHDRTNPVNAETTLLGVGQGRPHPITASGWYAAAGYKMSDSIFVNDCNKLLKNVEFAVRYEAYENVMTEDLVEPDTRTDLFNTKALTLGVNYFIKGHDAKIQANYIIVDDPSGESPDRGLREVQNNVFVVNFQIMF